MIARIFVAALLVTAQRHNVSPQLQTLLKFKQRGLNEQSRKYRTRSSSPHACRACRFRRWFLEFDTQLWDRQIEEDLRKGRLDKLAEEALTAHRSGKSKEV
jgi:hypothetical protein